MASCVGLGQEVTMLVQGPLDGASRLRAVINAVAKAKGFSSQPLRVECLSLECTVNSQALSVCWGWGKGAEWLWGGCEA